MGHLTRVRIDGENHLLEVPGKWRLASRGERALAPGDLVELSRDSAGWKMERALERRNHFTRRDTGLKPLPQVLAANLDFAVIIAAAADPLTPFGLVDRLLVTAESGGVTPVLIVNKIDLSGLKALEQWRANYRLAVEHIIPASAKTGEGVQDLADLINGRRVMLAGASGVGKSSLINRLEPSLNLKTAPISHASGRGKHTTASAELLPVREGWVIDTPGLRECAPWGLTNSELSFAFPEIRAVNGKCKFRNCLHQTEVDCEVQRIAGSRKLPLARYESYLKLLSELNLPPGALKR